VHAVIDLHSGPDCQSDRQGQWPKPRYKIRGAKTERSGFLPPVPASAKKRCALFLHSLLVNQETGWKK